MLAEHRRYRIVSARDEGAVGRTLVLEGALAAQPGQFVMVWLPGVEERPLAVVDTDPLTLTVQAIGPFTRALCALDAGDALWVRGPFGRGYVLHGARHLLVGGGSGTASLALLAQVARARGDAVTVALGARTADGLMLVDHFAALGCTLRLATDDGSRGTRGTVLAAITDLLNARWPEAVYACGPEAMLRALLAVVPGDIPLQLCLERAMKCGLGICGHCHCGEYLVCRDGPVFPAELVAGLLGDG